MTVFMLTEHPFYTKIEFAGGIHTIIKAYYSKVNTAKKDFRRNIIWIHQKALKSQSQNYFLQH